MRVYQGTEMKDEMFFVRTTIQHLYSTGSSEQRQPKLYAKGAAVQKAVNLNEWIRRGHPQHTIGMKPGEKWEVVPAIIKFGKPVDLEEPC